jgi:hypothetical protein
VLVCTHRTESLGLWTTLHKEHHGFVEECCTGSCYALLLAVKQGVSCGHLLLLLLPEPCHTHQMLLQHPLDLCWVLVLCLVQHLHPHLLAHQGPPQWLAACCRCC